MAPSRTSTQQLLALLCLSSASLVHTANVTPILSCLQKAGINTTVSTDPTWVNATEDFNLRIPREPIAVTYPENRDEVAAALKCARHTSTKVRAVGKAHSFQAYGYGNPGNLVINLHNFDHLSYDKSTKELTFGGGANVGPAAKFLYDNYDRHIVHVRGSHVGLAGSYMGGGYGSTSRLFGIAADSLVEVEYMLYNGSVVTACAGSDLLWGARGAGPNFGIVLQGKIKTHDIPSAKPLNYTIQIGDNPDATTSARAFLAIQKWALSGHVPDELSLRFSLPDGSSSGYFYGGDKAAFDRTFAPLLDALKKIVPETNVTTFVKESFWDSEVEVTGPGMNLPGGGDLGSTNFFIQSWVPTIERPLTLDSAKALLQAVKEINAERKDINGGGFADLWAGVNRKVKDTDAAYTHAGNLFLIRVDAAAKGDVWPADGVPYIQKKLEPFESAMAAKGSLRSFPNYVSTEFTFEQWSSRLYGANFKRLQSIKGAVDPTELFSGYHLAIPLAA